jgi:hypothetical protein
MILEVAVLYIISGNNKSFEADFKEAGQYIYDPLPLVEHFEKINL